MKMRLWEVKITDKLLPRQRKQRTNRFVVMAESDVGAVATLRDERPQAFVFAAFVQTQPWGGKVVVV
jgi:hypothetical protein